MNISISVRLSLSGRSYRMDWLLMGIKSLDHPLASGFSLADGSVEVEVPVDVYSRKDYFIICECVVYVYAHRKITGHAG